MGATVLIADDDPEIAELMRLYLEKDGIILLTAETREATIESVETLKPSLVVLDIMFPGANGLEICAELRNKGYELPIIMLTARDEESDRVLGLELGADDYVTKPFSPRELAARVQANLRRSATSGQDQQLEVGTTLMINTESRSVSCKGEAVDLTPKEFELLATLAKQPGRVFTREQLLNQVWGYDYHGTDRTVDTHIKRLRQKLHACCSKAIKTVWGVGYKVEAND